MGKNAAGALIGQRGPGCVGGSAGAATNESGGVLRALSGPLWRWLGVLVDIYTFVSLLGCVSLLNLTDIFIDYERVYDSTV